MQSLETHLLKQLNDILILQGLRIDDDQGNEYVDVWGRWEAFYFDQTYQETGRFPTDNDSLRNRDILKLIIDNSFLTDDQLETLGETPESVNAFFNDYLMELEDLDYDQPILVEYCFNSKEKERIDATLFFATGTLLEEIVEVSVSVAAMDYQEHYEDHSSLFLPSINEHSGFLTVRIVYCRDS